jgi:hypothetical protein
MHRLIILICIAGIELSTAGSSGVAAPRSGDNPDWPCQQRLVPTIGAATFWSTPGIETAGNWNTEPRVVELVRIISPRSVTAAQGEAAILAFVEGLGAGENRQRLLTLVFEGLLEETNRARSEVIARLDELGRRQREMASIASRAGEELRTVPADATGEDAARRADLEQRFTFVTRAFESTQRTMRYACEVPVQLEARLGRYARFLQARL